MLKICQNVKKTIFFHIPNSIHEVQKCEKSVNFIKIIEKHSKMLTFVCKSASIRNAKKCEKSVNFYKISRIRGVFEVAFVEFFMFIYMQFIFNLDSILYSQPKTAKMHAPKKNIL